MKRICPNPIPWSSAFERLKLHATSRHCIPPSPPLPLILAGWAYTNDCEKMQRWEETVAWAERNGCTEIVSEIPDSDFYSVDSPTTYSIGPSGGPMYRSWDFDPKPRPSSEEICRCLVALTNGWSEIVGEDLARVTRPLAFSGMKARRLLVHADANARPPWGEWFRLSRLEPERRTFTQFRAAINKAIAPHETDHVDFITDREPAPNVTRHT
jgi:hypothetical protein